ncbi:CD209 antigen-like protein E [Salmo trutta]|uniref:CD209 antigen-like protein E n=1 Tax=Salmo trutta TaxID=8032 RepID=UPI001130E19E|nr:CD209 antigen-like protein E [Salmo trutta]
MTTCVFLQKQQPVKSVNGFYQLTGVVSHLGGSANSGQESGRPQHTGPNRATCTSPSLNRGSTWTGLQTLKHASTGAAPGPASTPPAQPQHGKNQAQSQHGQNKTQPQHPQTCLNSKERDQLQTSYNTLTKERDQLQTCYNTLTKERAKLQTESGKFTNLSWQKFESSLYFLSTESKTWKESREDCLKRGADLVIINSDKEQTFLFNLKKGVWIGLTDSVNEGTWKWVDCTPLTTRYWSPNQPDNGGGLAIYGEEDCVHIQQHQSPLEAWNDLSCDSKLKWICEKVL